MSHFYEEEPPEPTDDIAAGNQLWIIGQYDDIVVVIENLDEI